MSFVLQLLGVAAAPTAEGRWRILIGCLTLDEDVRPFWRNSRKLWGCTRGRQGGTLVEGDRALWCEFSLVKSRVGY